MTIDKKPLRCIHRHTIEEHPNCFKQGLIKNPNWWEGLTIGTLDIETSDLDAPWGFMLSWCIKHFNSPKIDYDIITKKEIFDYEFDRRIIKSLVDDLKNFDILITYYGTNFDIKFMRSRAMYFGYEFPGYGSMYHWDLYFKVKGKFKLHNNKLATITQFLGIEGKTPLTPEILLLARYGEPRALKYVLDHNIADVDITERVYHKIKEHSKWIKRSI